MKGDGYIPCVVHGKHAQPHLTRVIGDVHGIKYDYETIASLELNPDITGSIQLGDMGIGMGQGDFWHDSMNHFMNDNNARMIRGNHDNPAECKKTNSCITDGTVENDIMFVGGAWSIDHLTRTPGVDWWRDEELSYSELDTIISIYETAKPRIMFTHDCPTLAAYYMFIRERETLAGRIQYLTRTGEALQAMFEIHQPEFWFFGHWHDTVTKNLNNTTFVCLGELDYIDIDLDDSVQINHAIKKKFTTE